MNIHVFYWFDGDEKMREEEISVDLPGIEDLNHTTLELNAMVNGAVMKAVSDKLRVAFISSANVPSDLSLLAFGIPPAREADQQEACRKSRRDRD